MNPKTFDKDSIIDLGDMVVVVDREAKTAHAGAKVIETHNSITPNTICDITGDWDLSRSGYADLLIVATMFKRLSGVPLIKVDNTDDIGTILKRMKQDGSFKEETYDTSNAAFNYAFTKGYKEASKSKNWTDADMRKAIELARDSYRPMGNGDEQYTYDLEEILQSMQRKVPTSITIDIDAIDPKTNTVTAVSVEY